MEVPQMAARCKGLFEAGEYDICLQELEKLRALEDDDVKILHNIAVCKHRQSRCSTTPQLLKDLQGLRNEIDRRRVPAEEAESADEVDYAVLNCNLGIVSLQLKQYSTSAGRLEKMFRNIEPVDEFLSMRVCMVLLDCLCFSRNAERAAQVVACLDKLVSNIIAQRHKAGKELGEKLDAKAAACGFSSIPDLKLILNVYKAKQYLLIRNAKAAKREIKSAMNAVSPMLEASSPLMLKSHLEYLRGNYKKSQKLLYSVSDPATASIQVNNMGCLHFRANKFGAAAMFFKKSLQMMQGSGGAVNGSGQGMGAERGGYMCQIEEVSYSLGLQHLLQGRAREAFGCFQQAARLYYNQPRLWIRMAECCIGHLAVDQREREAHAHKDMVNMGADKDSRQHVLLPCGVSSGRGSVHTPEDTKRQNGSHPTVGGAIGAQGLEESNAFPGGSLTYEYALKCLESAMVFLKTDTETAIAEAVEESWRRSKSSATVGGQGVELAGLIGSVSREGEDASMLAQAAAAKKAKDKEDRWNMAQSALLGMAYVCLLLNNPVKAIASAHQLLAQESSCTKHTRFLARMYAAEALCVLQKYEQATEMLEPMVAGHDGEADEWLPSARVMGACLAYACHDREGTSPEKIEAARRSSLFVNLACIRIMRNQLLEARECIKKAVEEIPHSPQALMVAVYLEMRQGNNEAALRMLKSRRLDVR